MNITLDGFMAGPDCELDWHFRSWNEEMARTLSAQLDRADTILLGRITYKAMAKYWPLRTIDPHMPREDIQFMDMMNNYRKIVFSKTLTAVDEWNNSQLVTGDLAMEIDLLKNQPGKHMIIYGSGQMIRSMMQMELVDEYQLWIHPVVLGKGKPLFRELQDQSSLRLLQTRSFMTGVVMLRYEVIKSA